jgi:hypothetical protein
VRGQLNQNASSPAATADPLSANSNKVDFSNDAAPARDHSDSEGEIEPEFPDLFACLRDGEPFIDDGEMGLLHRDDYDNEDNLGIDIGDIIMGADHGGNEGTEGDGVEY